MNWPMYTYTVVLSRNLPYLLAGEDVEQIMITEFKMWNGMSYDKALFTRVSFQLFRQVLIVSTICIATQNNSSLGVCSSHKT